MINFCAFLALFGGIAPLAAKPNAPLVIVVKGQGKEQPSIDKPLCDIPFDPYETIRRSLEPDQSLFLALSPAIDGWSRDRPIILMNSHLLQPWNDGLFKDLQTMRLRIVSVVLEDQRGRRLDLEDLKGISWSLSIVDENGQVFERFKGDGVPPEMIPWNGRSGRGQWLAAGHDYSAIYVFSRQKSAPHTFLGQPLRFPAVTHKVPKGMVIGLDSSLLFGPQRDQVTLAEPGGLNLLRASADWIRRRAHGSDIAIRIFSADKELAEAQALQVKNYLVSELSMPAKKISIAAFIAAPSDVRLDLQVGAGD